MVVTSPEAGELVISAWSALSPFGFGADAFAEGLRAGAPAVPADPLWQATLIPGFDIKQAVGPKGTRSMDRVTGIAVATVGLLLRDCGPGAAEPAEETGLVLGTGTGSVQSIMDFITDSLTGDKPYHVDPARFPNTVMNRAAGQSAIWHGLRGPNSTISGGAVAGLLALNYAARLHRAGRCTRVLCGSVEEFSEQRAWLEWHGNGRPDLSGAAPLGEGCAMFLLESAAEAARGGRAPVAVLEGSGFAAFPGPERLTEILAGCVARTLERTGYGPADVRAVATSGTPGALGDGERAAVEAVLGPDKARPVDCRALLGDTSAASAAFQLAALLATKDSYADEVPGVGLVTSVDRSGTVGCTVVRALAGETGTKEREGSHA